MAALNANQSETAPVPTRRLATRVTLGEVVDAGMRLEAATFNIDAREAMGELRASGIELRPLYGPRGICDFAGNAFRFRRVYVDEDHGIPFLSSSDIIDFRPSPEAFLSRKLSKRLSELLVHRHDILISCSGTVGNVALAGNALAGAALSQHCIRLRAPETDTAGFLAAFLRTRFGRLQLTSAKYGSVVTHIEPEHLKNVLVPFPHAVRRIAIGRLFVEASTARDKANDLLENANSLLKECLGFSELQDIYSFLPRPDVQITRVSGLCNKLEAHFHSSLLQKLLAEMRNFPDGFSALTDPAIVKEIRPITKFRKRTYVEAGGIPLLSSKQLFQVDPIDIRRLARGAHLKDMAEIALVENMILITRSGTIGRVQIVPRYMSGWAGSEHATRLIAVDPVHAGYLYAWLASDYGRHLIRRYAYGSVILEIDKEMIGSLPVPNISETLRASIAELVLAANKLRDDAWQKETKAKAQIEALISRASLHVSEAGVE